MEAKNPYKRGGMFEGAAPIIFENAKQLRKNMTDADIISRLKAMAEKAVCSGLQITASGVSYRHGVAVRRNRKLLKHRFHRRVR